MVGYYIDSGTTTSTASTVWRIWSSAAGDYPSCNESSLSLYECEYTTTTATTVWHRWTDAHYIAVPHEPLSAEEAAVLAAQQQAEAEEHRRRAAEAEKVAAEERKKAEEAEARAEQLLRQHLSDEQLADYDAHGHIHVIGADGVRYRLEKKWSGNILEFKGDRAVARYCVHPRERIPVHDSIMAQKLMLETDPASLKKIANRTELPSGMAV